MTSSRSCPVSVVPRCGVDNVTDSPTSCSHRTLQVTSAPRSTNQTIPFPARRRAGRTKRVARRLTRTAAVVIVAVSGVCTLVGCDATTTLLVNGTSATAAGTASPAVRRYVDDAVALMKKGIYADTDTWRSTVKEVVPALYLSPTIADTFAGLNRLAHTAGGSHSRLLTSEQVAQDDASYEAGKMFPTPTAVTTDGITTVTLPAFDGQTQLAMDAYQDAGIAAVRSATTLTTCGWIVDLRENGGGNTWPMLSTVAPLLSDGNIFGFQDRNGTTTWVGAANGNLQSAPDGVTVGVANFHVRQPVAILTSHSTASAAELVVVAFAGQPHTARVGSSTGGYTTGNEAFTLSNGALLVLTTSWYVDRTGTRYSGAIGPDILTTPDHATAAARTWLTQQCG